METLTQDNLAEIIASTDKVVVQYGATWCGMCRILKPKFERLSGENEGVKFIYVDAEEFPVSRELAVIENLPTFAAFKDGKIVKQVTSSKEEAIAEVINEITGN
jgi:thiol-disulfide isomerase/thioredoxin